MTTTIPLWIARLCMMAASLLALSSGAAAAGQSLTTLQPGAFREIVQDLEVNVVFVGFAAPHAVDEERFKRALPASYQSIHRYPTYYGARQPTGNRFNFRYRIVQADAAYANALFGYLSTIAKPELRTFYQDEYNKQAAATVKVQDNHWIDAPSVERWLAGNAPAGVDTSKYTVYFINWYGRQDFRFHVFTKTDSPDPDTGYNFGLLRSSRKIVAWGGTPPASGSDAVRRVWFYDFSAGPEYWNGNYDISNADFDGDGAPDYRIPPIWDYGNQAAYRRFDDLTGDAAKLTRFAAINLLFTTSPLYKPAISPPRLPGHINVDINLYQGDSTSNARDFLDRHFVTRELGGLQRHNTFSADVSDWAFDGRAYQTYLCFFFDQSCYGNRLFGIAFGDLFLYHGDRLMQFLEGDPDYEVPVFNYNTPTALSAGLLGFADDNWRDGTQSYVFGFLSPAVRQAGYGFSTTTTHEVGHHLGMSHPHDGYDSELDIDYGASGPFYYVWSGDESNTIMHYLDLATSFSQFDRDNMDRWLTAAYINQANSVLARIQASPRASAQAATLMAADAKAAEALVQYQAMNYPAAVVSARMANAAVLAAAAAIGVKIEPQAYQADYKAKGRSPKFVDTVDYRKRLAP
jgi:hypothetical protein